MNVLRLAFAAHLAVLLLTLWPSAPLAEETPDQKLVVSIERIWDRAGHSAFTDLLAHDGYLYCTFREGSGHIPGLNGVIRVVRSRDRSQWESVAVLDEARFDLRDPKLSLSPDGRLVVNMGASIYHGSKRLGIESRVAFGGGDRTFSPPQPAIFPDAMKTSADWLWRLTWHKGEAWGCVQQLDGGGGQRGLRLVKSRDAIRYELVHTFNVADPSETTLRFAADETLVAMIRRAGPQPNGMFGFARPPYTEWTFVACDRPFGGPNLVQLPGGAWLAGSRDAQAKPNRTQLWLCDPQRGKFTDLLTLPSSGDNSYPGFVVDQQAGRLYVSYYSSHEGKAAIYLATLRLDAIEHEAGQQP
jgi:hypothetical protein